MLRFPNLPALEYVRTCQECGHSQIARDPAKYRHEVWRDTKCRKCKSEALDYGQVNLEDMEDIEEE